MTKHKKQPIFLIGYKSPNAVDLLQTKVIRSKKLEKALYPYHVKSSFNVVPSTIWDRKQLKPDQEFARNGVIRSDEGKARRGQKSTSDPLAWPSSAWPPALPFTPSCGFVASNSTCILVPVEMMLGMEW